MDLLSRVSTPEGGAIVFTKSRYLFIWKMPRTSVMPHESSSFVGGSGFQVRYNTCDAATLQELHETMVFMVSSVGCTVLAQLARLGAVPYPPEKKHLERFVRGLV